MNDAREVQKGWLVSHDEFRWFLGTYHALFSAVDLVLDMAIKDYLNISTEQAHIITAGMMFGQKCRLLSDLIRHSDRENKGAILEPFNKVRAEGDSRSVITHGYIRSNSKTVTFILRITSGKYTVKRKEFTLKEFQDHVQKFAEVSTNLFNALGYKREEIDAFGDAAANLKNKS